MAQEILEEFTFVDYDVQLTRRMAYLTHTETGEKLKFRFPARSSKEWGRFYARPLLWLHGKVYGDK